MKRVERPETIILVLCCNLTIISDSFQLPASTNQEFMLVGFHIPLLKNNCTAPLTDRQTDISLIAFPENKYINV